MTGTSAEERVRAALAGEPVPVAGMSFVPTQALESLRWGSGRAPALVAAACSAFAPDFVFVPADEPWADEALDKVLECGSAVMWAVPGPFGRAAEALGWPRALRESASAPADLSARLEETMPLALEQVRRGARLGATAVVIADDLAGADGPLVAPDFALDEIVPRCARLADEAAQSAVASVFHSDGDVRHLFGALARGGISAVHVGGLMWETLERTYAAARSAGLVLVGGLPAADLRRGAAAAIEDASRALVLAHAGGLMVADDGGITSSEEVAALIAAVRSIGLGSDGA